MQRAAALVESAIEEIPPAVYPLSNGQRGRQEEGEEEQQQQQRSDNPSSPERQHFPPKDEQPRSGAALIQLSALRRREQELSSREAVLHDRMTRARPSGLLATAASKSSVSVSAVVSDSSPAVLASGLDSGGSDDAIARLVGAIGGGALTGNTSTVSSVTAAATPGRYRHGQRRRRMSVPLLHPLEDSGGGLPVSERRRPWTTSHGEAAAAEDVVGGEERVELGGTIQPFRWGTNRCRGLAPLTRHCFLRFW